MTLGLRRVNHAGVRVKGAIMALCGQCGQQYREEDNRDGACTYHPGPMLDCDSGRPGQGLPLDIWGCCSRQLQTTPFDEPGCVQGRHVRLPPGEPWPFLKPFVEHERALAEARRSELTRWDPERIALAERRIVEFLRGTSDPGPIRGRPWSDLLGDVRVLGDDRLDTLLRLVADPQYAMVRQYALVPLLRVPPSRAPGDSTFEDERLALLVEPLPHPQARITPPVAATAASPVRRTSSDAPDVWDLDRLLTAFPALQPERSVVASVPDKTVSETARVDDEDSRQQAEITLALAPADEFVVRFDASLPAAGVPSETLEAEIARGAFKAALRRVVPPALGCHVSIQHVTLTADATGRVAHAAAYRAFAAASLLCKWTLAAPFPQVAITPGESIESAHRRVVQAFAGAGFGVEEPLRPVPASLTTAVSAFSYSTGVEGGSRCTHLFYVCPQPWTPQTAQAFRAYLREVEYGYFHDGELREVHMLAAYPLEPA